MKTGSHGIPILMVTLLMGLAATALTLHLVLSAQSASQSDQSDFSLEGKITEREPGKLTVNTQDNIIFHVVYDEKTEIKRKDGTQGSAKDLRTGVRVKVDGKLSESGQVISRRIELE